MLSHPWLRSYPAGMDWTAPVVASTVQQILDDAVARWSDRPAVDFMGRKISYGELGRLGRPRRQGPAEPRRWPRRPCRTLSAEHAACDYRLFRYSEGWRRGRELFAAGRGKSARTQGRRQRDRFYRHPERAGALSADGPPARQDAPQRLDRRRTSRKCPAIRPPSAPIWKAPNRSCRSPPTNAIFPLRSCSPTTATIKPILSPIVTKTIAVLQYTGGTTGLPKGAMLTHANLTAASYQYWMSTQGEAPPHQRRRRAHADRAAAVPYLRPDRQRAAVHPDRRRDDHARAFRTRADDQGYRGQARHLVFRRADHVSRRCWAIPALKDADLSSLKYCCSGGAPLPVEVLQRFKEKTGCDISEGWGMTETSPAGTFTPTGRPPKPGSCGIPFPGITLKFVSVDNPDKEVALGERGELCISRAQRHARLLEERQGDGRDADSRRFSAHRRCRLHGRGRLCLYRRPHQGHAAMRRLQRLSAQYRGSDLPASRRSPKPASSACRTPIADSRRKLSSR